MADQQRVLVFGDDGSAASDTAWLWVNNHRWTDWRLERLTASTVTVKSLGPLREVPELSREPFPDAGFADATSSYVDGDPRLVLGDGRPCRPPRRRQPRPIGVAERVGRLDHLVVDAGPARPRSWWCSTADAPSARSSRSTARRTPMPRSTRSWPCPGSARSSVTVVAVDDGRTEAARQPKRPPLASTGPPAA